MMLSTHAQFLSTLRSAPIVPVLSGLFAFAKPFGVVKVSLAQPHLFQKFRPAALGLEALRGRGRHQVTVGDGALHLVPELAPGIQGILQDRTRDVAKMPELVFGQDYLIGVLRIFPRVRDHSKFPGHGSTSLSSRAES